MICQYALFENHPFLVFFLLLPQNSPKDKIYAKNGKNQVSPLYSFIFHHENATS